MNRRRLLQSLSLAPLAGAASKITVTGLETFVVRVNRRGNWILTRLTTSAGLTGIGDASHGGKDAEKIELLKQFFELLKGRSILDIEPLRQAVQPEIARRGSVAAVALSGLEQCLWDIAGKALGVPACDLFGGRLRSKIRNYANINRSVEDRTPQGFARMAESAVRAGFDAVKLAPWDGLPRNGDPGPGVECAVAVRKVIGSQRDLLLDAHSRFDLEQGLDLARRLEPLNLYWLEEVTQAVANLAAINKAAKMPTAGGEAIYGVKGFYPYIAEGAVDIVMPDVKYCGGMLELKKIAAMAEGAGLTVAPHGPASPVGNLAAAHVCATLPNFQILEFSYGEVPWRAELIDPPEELLNGHITLSDRPGFGVTLNHRGGQSP